MCPWLDVNEKGVPLMIPTPLLVPLLVLCPNRNLLTGNMGLEFFRNNRYNKLDKIGFGI
jgi:hypothetical protein